MSIASQSQSQSQSQKGIQVPDKFFQPFYKLSLAQLAGATREGGIWRVHLSGPSPVSLEVHMVWLQAVVETVSKEGDSLVLEEGGTRVTVTGLSANPGGASWVSRGQYLQVIGQLRDIIQGEPRVECKTLRNLSEDRVVRDLWPLEVAELHNLLTERITISD